MLESPRQPAVRTSRITIEVHAGPATVYESLADDVARGLTAAFKELPPKYFYDERGSELFEEITRQPEYYPTRCEREILTGRAAEILSAAGNPAELVELGSGSAAKTRVLLDAMHAAGNLERYVPVDISLEITERTVSEIAGEYPEIAVDGIVCDLEEDLELVPDGSRRLIAFLGGTIGNYDGAERTGFLRRIAGLMNPGDRLLLGTDLVKGRAELEAAYDDGAGVTSAFNKNVLSVLNRELAADFDLHQFEHVARWDDANSRVDIRLRSLRDQTVSLRLLDLDVPFAAGEEMRTEVSCKFTRASVQEAFAAAGLRLAGWFTDAGGRYALSLAAPSAGA